VGVQRGSSGIARNSRAKEGFVISFHMSRESEAGPICAQQGSLGIEVCANLLREFGDWGKGIHFTSPHFGIPGGATAKSRVTSVHACRETGHQLIRAERAC
jgi:hypothetical protein